MHHARFQNVQSLINPLILDEPIALIGTYNLVRLKAARLKTSWRIKLTKFVDRGGMVAKSKIENGIYFLGQENEEIDDEAASRDFRCCNK